MSLEETLRRLVLEANEPLRAELAELRVQVTSGLRAESAGVPDFLTPAQVAKRLQVDAKTVGRWIQKGALRSCRAGREHRIRPSDLDEFLSKPSAYADKEESADDADGEWGARCRYGAPGDRLWVKETWRAGADLDPHSPSKIDAMAKEAGYERAFGPVRYDADGADRCSSMLRDFGGTWGKTRVSIHMPRWASRITLEVTDVRVQRLQEMSYHDALDEGIYQDSGGFHWEHPAPVLGHADPRYAFAGLWDSINKARGFGCDANPWVWAITFRVLR